MAITPNLGFRFPVSTDTPNVPRDIERLAVDLEALLGGVQAFTATGTITMTTGSARKVTFSGPAAQTITLPAATVGREVDFENIDTVDAVTVSRAGADTFLGGATSLTVQPGEAVVFRCLAAGVWRALVVSNLTPEVVAQAQGWITAAAAASTYTMPSGGSAVIAGAADEGPALWVPLDPAEHAVAGKTCQVRLRGRVNVNAVAPTGNFTFKANQITGLGGGAGVVAVSASTTRLTSAALVTPAAGSMNQVVSPWTDFIAANIPAGLYNLTLTTTAAIAASSRLNLSLLVEKRYV